MTLGVHWYLSRNVKASLNLEHSGFSGGASAPVTGGDEKAVLSRLQLRF